MDRQEKQLRNWKAVAATFVAISFLLTLVLVIAGVKNIIGSVTGKPAETQSPTAASSETEITESTIPSEETEITETTEAEEVDALSLWTAGAESKEALVSYVEAVTDENSPDYIPVEDRITSITASWYTVYLKILNIRIRLQHSRRMLPRVFRLNSTVTRTLRYP